MSNQAVGNIYAQIIEKVIQESKNDFEESGIDQATLQELKEKWQQRASAYHVASFPWDPAPAPNQAQNPPTLPSNAQRVVEDSPSSASAPHPPNANLTNGVRVKTEPGYENGPQSYSAGMNGYPAPPGGTIASQRAATLLQQQYGNQAASIAHGMAQPQPGFALPGQPRPMGIQLPGQPQQRPPPPQQQQQQQYPPQPQQPPQQQRAPLSAAQTDGADDDNTTEWLKFGSKRTSRTDADRTAADAQIRAQIDAMAYRMDNGLMVPLAEVPRPSKDTKRKRKTAHSSSNPTEPSSLPTISQLDGVDDDDDDDEKPDIKQEDGDEDAINSDLDDSEDEFNQPVEEDEGAAVNEAILCTYDKVQRVKNKWKCTLKDGVLSTKGRDYVFHKAQGEFEW